MLVLEQLLAGRDFARNDRAAAQMINFVYLIADDVTHKAMLVDPAWDIEGLVEHVEKEGYTLDGALVTHYHPDHVGGDLMGYSIEGARELLAMDDVSAPLHVQRAEAPGVKRVTGASDSDLVVHDSGDEVRVGDVPIRLLHTPGHTPGSQCFLVDGRLVAGDTLFLEGCGRTDLPGGDAEAMYESITQRLAAVPDDTVLFPGHLYSPEPSATMGETRRSNYVFRFPTRDAWLSMFGA
jgi:glyoxylase-like metal-dependent hydrolase (beta-lactamase superfamily II)